MTYLGRASKLLSGGLIFLLSVLPLVSVRAGAQASGAVAPAGVPRALRIVVLDGEETLDEIRQRTAREPIVEVQDENHRPVAGAFVLFTVRPGADGAGASFGSGLTTLAVTTGADGRASAPGLARNGRSGEFKLEVSASVAGVTTQVLMELINRPIAGPGETPAAPPNPEPALPSAPQPPAEPAQPTPGSAQASGAPTGLALHFQQLQGEVKRHKVITASAVAAIVLLTVLLSRRGGSGTTITAGTGTVTHP